MSAALPSRRKTRRHSLRRRNARRDSRPAERFADASDDRHRALRLEKVKLVSHA
jgi:hypothetical protein